MLPCSSVLGTIDRGRKKLFGRAAHAHALASPTPAGKSVEEGAWGERKDWVGGDTDTDQGPTGEGGSKAQASAGARVNGAPPRLGGGKIRAQVAHPEA